MKPSYLRYENLDALDLPAIRGRLAEVAAFTTGARPDLRSDPASSFRWWTRDSCGGRQLQIRVGPHGERSVVMARSTDRRGVMFTENYAITSEGKLGETGESEIRAAVAAWRRALRLPAFLHPSEAPEIVDTVAGIALDVAAMLIQHAPADHGISSLEVTFPTIGIPGSLASWHGGKPLASAAVRNLVARLPTVVGLKSGIAAGQYCLSATSAQLRVDLPDLSAVEAMRAVTTLPPELSGRSAVARRLRA